jgi:pimeloyl-ACP methyl ester carboxylesterase
MKLLVPLILFIVPTLARAENTKVFFVGGYASTAAQMRCWEKGAEKNSPGGYDFEGVAYPRGVGSGFDSAVGGAKADIARIVKEINANPLRHYVVAGHSSGCAIANTIATKVSHPERIKQVVLDGFTSPRIKPAQNVACWGALGKDHKPSRNYGAMGTCGSSRRTYHDTHCSAASQWCLHFSLVMKSTPANLSNFIAHGYDGCDTNLDWLVQ